MRHAFLLLTLAAAPVEAGSFSVDAFGLMPLGEETETRSDWSGLRVEGGANRVVMPGAPDMVLMIAGPKSIVAGKDRGHAVAIVLDQHGNTVADGTDVRFRIGGETVVIPTQTGIADRLFLPPPVAGEIIVGASTGKRQSPRAMVRVVPDIGSIQPGLIGSAEPAPHEAFFTIDTAELQDRFGNVADDGTAVTVTLRHANGAYSLSTATASKGEASARFLSRDISGATSVAAAVGQNTSPSDSFQIARPQALSLPEAHVTELPTIEAMQLAIGPFMTGNGHTLPDGAPVIVEIVEDTGQRHSVSTWTRDGYISAMLPVASVREMEQLFVISPLGHMELQGQLADVQQMEVME